jgi:hypothetical protein
MFIMHPSSGYHVSMRHAKQSVLYLRLMPVGALLFSVVYAVTVLIQARGGA